MQLVIFHHFIMWCLERTYAIRRQDNKRFTSIIFFFLSIIIKRRVTNVRLGFAKLMLTAIFLIDLAHRTGVSILTERKYDSCIFPSMCMKSKRKEIAIKIFKNIISYLFSLCLIRMGSILNAHIKVIMTRNGNFFFKFILSISIRVHFRMHYQRIQCWLFNFKCPYI